MSIIEDIALKFSSSNSVPVERATLTASEWRALVAYIAGIERERDQTARIGGVVFTQLHEAARPLDSFPIANDVKCDRCLGPYFNHPRLGLVHACATGPISSNLPAGGLR